ncbi:mesoderm induction early response protein 1-like [Hetaerina americana]|uniref:mesoderm induction early response protein 1-like n=1 Tax=Hetaerina americana TaxID=62018 RepID=UPI003A7F391E
MNTGFLGNQLFSSLVYQRDMHQSEEEDRDDSYYYNPDEDDEWRKTIMVGSDYQAHIPEGLCKYGDALPYENEDKLLWDPKSFKEAEFEKFLTKAQEHRVNNSQGIPYIPTGVPIRDDEQALYLLLQCGYNFEEALRRQRMNVVPPTNTMSLWSEEECRNFENGLRTYGKNFHLIHQNKVRTRSVGELVQFYYLWKKTERHDIFAQKARLEKKKYTFHPGVTDYMDRFLDEQDDSSAHRESSSSPSVNSLIYGDPKRQQQRGQESSNEKVNAVTATTSTTEPPAGAPGSQDKEALESQVNFAASVSGVARETGASARVEEGNSSSDEDAS